MKVLNAKEWSFDGITDDGFKFTNVLYPKANERITISHVAYEIKGTRYYFDFIGGKHQIRIPRRSSLSSSDIQQLIGEYRDLTETETSYFVAL